VAPAPTVRCRACGSSTAAAERFCRSCGNDLAARAGLADLAGWRDEAAERTEVIPDLPAGPAERRPAAAPAPGPGPGRPVAGALVVALGVLLLAVGAVGSWAVIEGKIKPPTTSSTPAPGAATSTGLPTRAGPSGPSGPAGPGPVSPTGLIAVAVAPALADRPETPEVVRLLTAYFTAIDERDFAALRRTLVPRPNLPQSDAEFRRRYKSTQDSDVRLLGLGSTADGGLIASVSFTSTQAPADSPDGAAPCLRWSIGYPVIRLVGALRIDEVHRSNVVFRHC
jgi:hypothetical protein